MCLVATTLSNPFEGCLVDVSGLMPAVFAVIPAAGLAVHSRADGPGASAVAPDGGAKSQGK